MVIKTAVIAVYEAMVIASEEAVVEARRRLISEDRSVPESGYPDLTSIVARPIDVDPRIAGSRARRNVHSVSRRSWIESRALRSEAQADGEAGLGKYGTSS